MDQYSLNILALNAKKPEGERKQVVYEKEGPLLGVAVMVKTPPFGTDIGEYSHHVLMGRRLKKCGYGTWSFPGGHVEFGEDPKVAAVRELKEETGLLVTLDELTLEGCVGSIHDIEAREYSRIEIIRKHYITVLYSMRYDQQKHGSPVNLEPDKTDGWFWMLFDRNLAPRPLFQPILNFTGWDK